MWSTYWPTSLLACCHVYRTCAVLWTTSKTARWLARQLEACQMLAVPCICLGQVRACRIRPNAALRKGLARPWSRPSPSWSSPRTTGFFDWSDLFSKARRRSILAHLVSAQRSLPRRQTWRDSMWTPYRCSQESQSQCLASRICTRFCFSPAYQSSVAQRSMRFLDPSSRIVGSAAFSAAWYWSTWKRPG